MLVAEKERGPRRRLFALESTGRAIPRPHMSVSLTPDVLLGEVTSGTHSPSLDVGIGMGYVPSAQASPETELVLDVRGKQRKARVVKKPIYRKESP